MQAFITYDLNRGHNDVKRLMLDIGYHHLLTSNSIIYYLPNTSLWKPDIELKTALNDIQNTINQLNTTGLYIHDNIILQRCIVLSAHPWSGIQGVPIS